MNKHAAALKEKAFWVNQVWNYDNDLSIKVLQREGRFLSGYDLDRFTAGATKEGLPLHSQTIQAINAEYATRRRQAKKAKLRWRVSTGSRRSLGWIPFKKSALQYRNGQLWLSSLDKPLSLWDSYGLADYTLGPGCISEDARGRWYINITVKVRRAAKSAGKTSVGIDLGLKQLFATSDGQKVEAKRFYRDLEPRLAAAQRANKPKRVKAIHAKIKNRRHDHLHQLSTALVRKHGAIFIGNVSASALAQTGMAKSVLDAGWSTFRTMLQYKGDDAGTWVDVVNENFSTQDCSVCGCRTGPKGQELLGVREWTCSVCGTHHDRDVNAARNILKRGQAQLEKNFKQSETVEAKACEIVLNKSTVDQVLAAGLVVQ